MVDASHADALWIIELALGPFIDVEDEQFLFAAAKHVVEGECERTSALQSRIKLFTTADSEETQELVVELKAWGCPLNPVRSARAFSRALGLSRPVELEGGSMVRIGNLSPLSALTTPLFMCAGACQTALRGRAGGLRSREPRRLARD